MKPNFTSHINYSKPWPKLLWRPMAVLTIAIVLLGIGTALQQPKNFWADMPQSKGAEHAEYCERNQLENFIRQPSNTWSNLGYLFYGLICFQLAAHDRKHKAEAKNLITRSPWLSVLFGLSFAYLCFGSFLFHASLTRMGQRWDMAATYTLLAAPIVVLAWQLNLRQQEENYVLKNSRWLTLSNVVITVTWLMLAVVFYVFKWQIPSHFLLPAMILITIILLLLYQAFSPGHAFRSRFAVYACAFIIAAFTLWYQDRSKAWCDPESIVQGHAAWHFLTGLGALFVYFWLRSEKPSVQVPISHA